LKEHKSKISQFARRFREKIARRRAGYSPGLPADPRALPLIEPFNFHDSMQRLDYAREHLSRPNAGEEPHVFGARTLPDTGNRNLNFFMGLNDKQRKTWAGNIAQALAVDEKTLQDLFEAWELVFYPERAERVRVRNAVRIHRFEKDQTAGEYEGSHAAKVESALAELKIICEVVAVARGPRVDTFALAMQSGARLSAVSRNPNDIAFALGVRSARLVYPMRAERRDFATVKAGRSLTGTLGLEVPAKKARLITFGEVYSSTSGQVLPVVIGVDTFGKSVVGDLRKLKHILIGGATGSGKSTLLHCIICGLVLARAPGELFLALIDTKRQELPFYDDMKNYLLGGRVVDEVAEAVTLFRSLEQEMRARQTLFKSARARNLEEYNAGAMVKLPHLVLVIDELADILESDLRKEAERLLNDLAKLARSAGIYLIMATQNPVVAIVTGKIKANMPARIALQVVSPDNSRVIINQVGANQLLGNGDMLFLDPATPADLFRVQGPNMPRDEIIAVVKEVSTRASAEYMLSEIRADRPTPKEHIHIKLAFEMQARGEKVSIRALKKALGVGHARAKEIFQEITEAKN
jgi:S-DNA-T family DNA segregation ATPase FtsK/SpoIIIE